MEEKEVVVEEPVETRDFDAEARQEGWVPQDEWNGPSEKWVDSKTFVDRGEKIAGILKSKVTKMEEEIARLNEANKQFGAYHKTQLQKEHEKNQKLIAELEAARKQAVSEGDGEAFERAERGLTDLRKNEVPQDVRQQNALAEQWVAENPWYNNSPKLGPYADGIAERVAAEGYSGKAYFNELTRRVKEAFPEEFTNTRRSQAGSVESGGEKVSSNSKSKTYDNLPAEATAACERFTKAGFMSKADFVAQYEWE